MIQQQYIKIISIVLTMTFMACSATVMAFESDSNKYHNPNTNYQKYMKKAKNRQNGIKDWLGLNQHQQKLFNKMQETAKALRQKTCPNPMAGCFISKEQIRAMHLFTAEIAAEKPDFDSVAKKLVHEYHGPYKKEFKAAVKAKAAFLKSLTPEQRDKMLRKHAGWHKPRSSGKGMYHGRGTKVPYTPAAPAAIPQTSPGTQIR